MPWPTRIAPLDSLRRRLADELWRADNDPDPELRADAKREAANLRRRIARRERDDAMRGLGLRKVRGAKGGTYWE